MGAYIHILYWLAAVGPNVTRSLVQVALSVFNLHWGSPGSENTLAIAIYVYVGVGWHLRGGESVDLVFYFTSMCPSPLNV